MGKNESLVAFGFTMWFSNQDASGSADDRKPKLSGISLENSLCSAVESICAVSFEFIWIILFSTGVLNYYVGLSLENGIPGQSTQGQTICRTAVIYIYI